MNRKDEQKNKEKFYETKGLALLLTFCMRQEPQDAPRANGCGQQRCGFNAPGTGTGKNPNGAAVKWSMRRGGYRCGRARGGGYRISRENSLVVAFTEVVLPLRDQSRVDLF